MPDLDKRGWDRLQRRLRTDDYIIVEPGYHYRWVSKPVMLSPVDALAELVRAAGGRVKPGHIDVVPRALAEVPDATEIAATHRQAVLDGVRMLAELASEVEELTVNHASARAMIHRVRSRVRLSDLEPIERAGDSVVFDRKRHQPIGRPIRDGASVIVVRPGYVWKKADEVVLVARAVVQE